MKTPVTMDGLNRNSSGLPRVCGIIRASISPPSYLVTNFARRRAALGTGKNDGTSPYEKAPLSDENHASLYSTTAGTADRERSYHSRHGNLHGASQGRNHRDRRRLQIRGRSLKQEEIGRPAKELRVGSFRLADGEHFSLPAYDVDPGIHVAMAKVLSGRESIQKTQIRHASLFEANNRMCTNSSRGSDKETLDEKPSVSFVVRVKRQRTEFTSASSCLVLPFSPPPLRHPFCPQTSPL
ncbi:hypothetical protein DPEC_G00344860 [Dallia pectoralis]|uniref:Uncharacterized protein n=1 Tax=Dallia pectoralis TaxID=75939 RepID=A0ACC2F3C1_DALPE|nr:hypothetical protein DPEC_G00344860 [Dallia pectoralis]